MSVSLWFQSLSLAAAVGLLALGIGTLAALALAGAGGWLRSALTAMTFLAAALPPFLGANHWLDLTAHWRALAGSSALGAGSWALAVLCLAALLWPVVTLLLLGAWTRLQPDVLESDPCIRGFTLLRGLLLPAARGELQVAAAIVITLALANFTVPVLFQIRVFTEEFWIRFNTQLDLAGALRSTWPLLITPLALLLLLRKRPIPWPRWRTDLEPGRVRRALGLLWPVALTATLLWLALTVAFPLARLAGTSRTWTELPGAFLAGRHALLNSFLTAAGTATVLCALPLLFLFAGERTRLACRSGRPRPGQSSPGLFEWWPLHRPPNADTHRSPPPSLTHLLPLALWLPFLLPGVFTGVALINLLNRPWTAALYQSTAILLLALAIRYAALAGALISQAHATADPALPDAARTLGAGPWRVFRDAVWPQVHSGAAAAWYLLYLLALWDVETIVLIQPPGGETLSLRIFNLLHYGHAAQVNALCILLLALALAPWMIWRLARVISPTARPLLPGPPKPCVPSSASTGW